MRAPHRPSRASAALLGALALTAPATAALLAGGSAAAQPPPREWVAGGEFDSPLSDHWSCTGEVTVTDGSAEGRPGSHDLAGCSQRVPVPSNARYDLSAVVSGAYAFVTVSGTGTGSGAVTLWADGPDRTTLSGSVEVGATDGVTLTFHGWYGQGPFRIDRVSLTGPRYPDVCFTPTGPWPPSPSPSPSPTPSSTWSPGTVGTPAPAVAPQPYGTTTCHPRPLR
ncbi:hypothetical protein ACIRBX_18385 [Kitasatospora sp. NPDC096147]|uniref:hypothetical protein n=1 Tax=Kitasatospora sp. NPDC096147 TaxID=3364093 RepID=UPI0037FBD475